MLMQLLEVACDECHESYMQGVVRMSAEASPGLWNERWHGMRTESGCRFLFALSTCEAWYG